MFFNWIRNQARQAVLAGVSDAAAELEGQEPSDASHAVTSLHARLRALPDRSHEKEEVVEAGKKKARA